MSIAEVIFNAKTPGQKAAATKKLNAFVASQVTQGKNERSVRAGVKASVTRLANS